MKFEENIYWIKEMKDIVYLVNVCVGLGRGMSSERKFVSGDLKKNFWGVGMDYFFMREEFCLYLILFS